MPYKTEIKKLNSGNFENLVNTTLYNLQENQIYPIKANLENGNYSVVFSNRNT